VIPEGEDVLQNYAFIGDSIYATYLDDVSDRIRVFALDGTAAGEVEVRAHSTAGIGAGGPGKDTILRHLGLPAGPPLLSPARGPPRHDLGFDADPGFDIDETPLYDPSVPEPNPDFDFRAEPRRLRPCRDRQLRTSPSGPGPAPTPMHGGDGASETELHAVALDLPVVVGP